MTKKATGADGRGTVWCRLAWAPLLASLGCGSADLAGGELGEPEEVGSQSSALLSDTAKRALVITDLTVVNNSTRTKDPCNSVAGDEDKTWTIGHLLKKEAQRYGLDPTTYVNKWLTAWTTETTINGQTAPTGEGPNVQAAWTRFGGTSRLDKAPFRLLAIVNRVDLRAHRPNGEPLGGEVRFVFGMLDPPHTGAITCPSPYFSNSTIIAEYSPVKADENAVLDWGKRWYDLAGLPFGSSYRLALQALTEDVINSGRLLRIRTNEGPTGTWFMSEFEPHPTTHYLVRSTIKQAPTMALADGTSTNLTSFISANVLNLGALEYRPRTQLYAPIGSYLVTDKFSGTNTWFRGSVNRIDSSVSGSFWNAPKAAIDPTTWSNARHQFSLGTCNGCHGRESSTGILHIAPRASDTAAGLSGFLSGAMSVTDPVDGRVRVLNEIGKREDDLLWLAGGGQVGTPVFGNYYKLMASTGGLCVDLEGNGLNDGALVKQYPCHGQGNQRLSLVYQGSSNYNLKFKHSGKCLDIENASTQSGARVIQKTCTNSTSQRFTSRITSGGGARAFQFIHSGMCFVPKDQSTATAAQLVQVNCANTDASGFMFIE